MTEHANLIKLREWWDSETPEPDDGWEWPAPPWNVESRVEGQLRHEILTKLARPADDQVEIRIMEIATEGGYSEYTSETYGDIEVWAYDEGQAQRVFETSSYTDDAFAAFLKWLES